MANENAGRLVFDRDLLDRGSDVLNSAPEKPAVDAVAAIGVTDGLFGKVPGADAVGHRIQQWADQGKTQMSRITKDVADLGRRTGIARELIDRLDEETRTLANSVSVQQPN